MIKLRLGKRLQNIQIDIAVETAAHVTALFGRSGCGKTTLINMVAGLIKPDYGYLEINGRVFFDSKKSINLPPEKRRIGYVFQEPRLFPHLSVAGNLEYGVKNRGQGKISFDKIIKLLGLRPLLSRRPEKLSGGEQQRVAIGRALLSNPDLLLMDEPLTSQDGGRKAEILPFLEKLCAETRTPVLFVSHSMEDVMRLANDMILMDLGKLIACGPVEEVASQINLYPVADHFESGAVIPVTINRHDEENGLSHLSFAGGEFLVPRLREKPGHKLRLHIRARDIILSLNKPVGVSSLNILYGRVKKIHMGNKESSHMDVLLDVGVPLWARITKLSGKRLSILEDTPLYAMVKTVAIDRQGMGKFQS